MRPSCAPQLKPYRPSKNLVKHEQLSATHCNSRPRKTHPKKQRKKTTELHPPWGVKPLAKKWGRKAHFLGTRWRASCAEQWRELCTRWLASCAARCFRGKRADSLVVLNSLARASRALRSSSEPRHNHKMMQTRIPHPKKMT